MAQEKSHSEAQPTFVSYISMCQGQPLLQCVDFGHAQAGVSSSLSSLFGFQHQLVDLQYGGLDGRNTSGGAEDEFLQPD